MTHSYKTCIFCIFCKIIILQTQTKNFWHDTKDMCAPKRRENAGKMRINRFDWHYHRLCKFRDTGWYFQKYLGRHTKCIPATKTLTSELEDLSEIGCAEADPAGFWIWNTFLTQARTSPEGSRDLVVANSKVRNPLFGHTEEDRHKRLFARTRLWSPHLCDRLDPHGFIG